MKQAMKQFIADNNRKIQEMASAALAHKDVTLRDQAVDQIGEIIGTWKTGKLTYTTPAGRQAKNLFATVEKWAALPAIDKWTGKKI